MTLPAPSKIVCVGRNYVAHAAELNNPIPSQPLLFIKPPSAIAYLPDIVIPTAQGECQHEIELAVYVATRLRKANQADAQKAIAGYGLALDLTLRDVQNTLKGQGQPWERAKAFDGACVLGPMLSINDVQQQPFELSLWVNGKLRQQGSTEQMIFTISDLLADISQQFTLEPGDIVLTGTPAGVAALQENDQLQMKLKQGQQSWCWSGVVRADQP